MLILRSIRGRAPLCMRGPSRPSSELSRPLAPAVLAAKSQTELYLDQHRADHVLHNKSTEAGITDLTFENRETEEKGKQRTVSVYFKMDSAGIRAYREAARGLSDNPSVELSYTPHFGQSRITFGWDYFWETVNSKKLGFVQPEGFLALEEKGSSERGSAP